MNNLAMLFEVYRATELSVPTRIRLLKKVGEAVNYTVGSNLTEPIVYELVKALDPKNPIGKDDHYSSFVEAAPDNKLKDGE